MTPKKMKYVRLTCQVCGMPYTIGTPDDIGLKCMQCGTPPWKSEVPLERGKFVTSIETLMGALKLGNDYKAELEAAKSMSAKVQSPYIISIE
jgi:hypothetical protein